MYNLNGVDVTLPAKKTCSLDSAGNLLMAVRSLYLYLFAESCENT